MSYVMCVLQTYDEYDIIHCLLRVNGNHTRKLFNFGGITT